MQLMKYPTQLLTGAVFCTGLVLSVPAVAVDWSAVPAKPVELFYPGQTGMEWIESKRDHDGAARYKKRKKDCKGCHEGDQKEYGPKIAKGGSTENDPLGGRRGLVTMNVQTVNDGSALHVRLEWPQAPSAAASKQDGDFDTKVTLMLDDGSVEEFTAGGCWAVCHQDSKRMPEASGDGEQKYLAESRKKIKKKVGGGNNYVSDGDLQGLMSAGTYLEYWQARLNPGQPATAVDGYILKERTENPSPAIAVNASEAGGNWVVEFSRPLTVAGPYKALAAGKTYMLGIALHDQNTEGRYHLTSLQYSLQLGGGDAEFVAANQ